MVDLIWGHLPNQTLRASESTYGLRLVRHVIIIIYDILDGTKVYNSVPRVHYVTFRSRFQQNVWNWPLFEYMKDNQQKKYRKYSK